MLTSSSSNLERYYVSAEMSRRELADHDHDDASSNDNHNEGGDYSGVGPDAHSATNAMHPTSSTSSSVIHIPSEALDDSPLLPHNTNATSGTHYSERSASTGSTASSEELTSMPSGSTQQRMTHRNVSLSWRPALVVGASTATDAGVLVAAPCPSARFGHTAVVYGDAMYLFGGREHHVFYNDVWKYPFETRRWEQVACAGQTPAGRAGHTATLVGSLMYVVGGCVGVSSNTCVRDVFVLDLNTNQWSKPAVVLERPPLTPRKGHTAVNYNNTCIAVFGGSCGTSIHDDNKVYRLDLSTHRWSILPVSGAAPSPRMYHIAEMTERNTMLVFGGKEASSRWDFSSDLFELQFLTDDLRTSQPAHGVWRKIDIVGPIRPAGRMCCSSIYHHGVLCVFLGGSLHYHDDCYEFDVTTREWRVLEHGKALQPCTRPTTVFHENTVSMFGGCTAENGFMNTLFELKLEAPSLKELCRQWMRHNTNLLAAPPKAHGAESTARRLGDDLRAAANNATCGRQSDSASSRLGEVPETLLEYLRRSE